VGRGDRSAPARICVFVTHTACYLSAGFLNNAVLDNDKRPSSDDMGDLRPYLTAGDNMSLEYLELVWCYSQYGLAKQYYVAAAAEVQVCRWLATNVRCRSPHPLPASELDAKVSSDGDRTRRWWRRRAILGRV
jgi:hypothetical protein